MRPRQVWGAILLLLIGSQAICVRAQQAPAAAAADPRAVIALEAGT